MHRHRRRTSRYGIALGTALTAAVIGLTAATALAQTTTTTVSPATTQPTTTTTRPATPTTVPVAPTTAPAGATTTSTTSPVATTPPPTAAKGNQKDDDGGFPVIPAIVAIVVIGAIAAGFAVWARNRGARRQGLADWRRQAADATAQAGAVARVLSMGSPPSGQIAQQLLASLRTFDDLADTAIDDDDAESAEQVHGALQTLGLAVDADYRLRRRQPTPPPDQLEASAEAVRVAASDADRTLRAVYRSFTGGD